MTKKKLGIAYLTSLSFELLRKTSFVLEQKNMSKESQRLMRRRDEGLL